MSEKGMISASLMCADLLNLEREIGILADAGVDFLHIDVMDAHFVPNLTFGPDFVNLIRQKTTLPLDIHLLMNHPRAIIRSMNIMPCDIVTIHGECKESILENAAFIKQRGAKFGLALNPDTEVGDIKKYLPYADVILLMLITPGFAGSSLIHGIMEKVSRTRAYLDAHGFDNIMIEVDGCINWDRAAYMRHQGADIFVGGTKGIFRTGLPIPESIVKFIESVS